MSCSDLGSIDFSVSTYPRSRIERRCDECGRAIAGGDTYERTACKWEGMIFTHRMCLRCAWLGHLVMLRRHDQIECWTVGELRSEIREALRDRMADARWRKNQSAA